MRASTAGARLSASQQHVQQQEHAHRPDGDSAAPEERLLDHGRHGGKDDRDLEETRRKSETVVLLEQRRGLLGRRLARGLVRAGALFAGADLGAPLLEVAGAGARKRLVEVELDRLGLAAGPLVGGAALPEHGVVLAQQALRGCVLGDRREHRQDGRRHGHTDRKRTVPLGRRVLGLEELVRLETAVAHGVSRQAVRTTTHALAPRPTVCPRATRAPSTWRASALPRSCQVSSTICPRAEAPSGSPFERSPPLGLTGSREPIVPPPLRTHSPPPPRGQKPSSSTERISRLASVSWTSATSTSSGPRPACSQAARAA